MKLTLSHAERLYLIHGARHAGMSLPDFIRTALGLRSRPNGRPTTALAGDIEDYAWDLIQATGVDPAPYFPLGEKPREPLVADESPAERIGRLERLRAATASFASSS